MKNNILGACLLAFASAAWADVIVMKNGDKVTGSIVKSDDKEIVIKSEFFGEVKLPWDGVVSVKTDQPLFFTLKNGQKVETKAAEVAGEKITIEPKTGTEVSANRAELPTIRNAAEQAAYERLLNPGWGQLWTGTVKFEFAGASGNASTRTLATGLNASRATSSDKTKIYFSAINAFATVNGVSSKTAQAVRGGLGYDHNLSKRLYWGVFNDYEYDAFQNLDLRIVVGSGVGYKLWISERGNFDLVGGASWNRESFGAVTTPKPAPAFTRNSGELYWGNDFNYKLSSRAAFIEKFRMFNNLTNTGEYRMNFDAGLVFKITKWMSWTATVSDRYLSNPLAGRKKNDFLYATGIGVDFSR